MLARLNARIACVAAATAILSLLALHALRPELSPVSHTISEYGVGSHAWVMALCFESFAVASVTLLVALAVTLRGALAWCGLFFLLLAAVGLAIGGMFPIDPNTNDPDAMSHSGQMHGLGFMLGVPGQLLAVLLLSLAMHQRTPWLRSPVRAWAAAIWISLIVMVPLLMQQGWFGLPNRTFMLAYAAWIIVCARPLLPSNAASRQRSFEPQPLV